jgi:hypothetical protein
VSRGCLCGALDCPSCGRAQGYEVARYWRGGRAVYLNPEDVEPTDVSDEDHEAEAADRAHDERIERSMT